MNIKRESWTQGEIVFIENPSETERREMYAELGATQREAENCLPKGKKLFDFSRRRLTALPFLAKQSRHKSQILREFPQAITLDSHP